MSSKLSIAYDSIRSRDKAIEDLEGQIGALESDKYAALYFYEKAMKGREEWQGKAFAAEAEVAALKARVAELETENLALISRIVETDCRDYGRDEYQTQSLANQVLIDRLVAAGRMRHKRNDHKGRPIYEFVHASSEGGP